jgi:hypothetical protein
MGYLYGLVVALALLVVLRWIAGSGSRGRDAPPPTRPAPAPGVWSHVETRRRGPRSAREAP